MSLEKLHVEPSFEAKNIALANEWPIIMVMSGLSVDANSLHHRKYGVDDEYSYESDARFMEGILERLANKGVTPENHGLVKALKRVTDSWNALDVLRNEQLHVGNDNDRAREIINEKAAMREEIKEAEEALEDAIHEHQPAVTGAF